jgi:activator of HSP90 ATPase
MFTTIQQSITFDAVSPMELFESYLDAERHAALVNNPASITDGPGAPFWVFTPGAVRGHNLHIDRGGLIAQAWRASVWDDADPDSVLVLTFAPHAGGGTRIHLTHAGVPARVHDTIAAGWHDNYWRPWRARLSRADRPQAAMPSAQA